MVATMDVAGSSCTPTRSRLFGLVITPFPLNKNNEAININITTIIIIIITIITLREGHYKMRIANQIIHA